MDDTTHKILCAVCRKPLYLFRGVFSGALQPKQFSPFPGVSLPCSGEPLLCPGCGKPWYLLNARTGGLMVCTDKGIKPHEPTLPAAPSTQQAAQVAPELPIEMRGANPDFTDTKPRQERKEKRK